MARLSVKASEMVLKLIDALWIFRIILLERKDVLAPHLFRYSAIQGVKLDPTCPLDLKCIHSFPEVSIAVFCNLQYVDIGQ